MRTRNSTRAAAAVQARKARASVMQTRSATGAKARKNNSRSSNVKKPSKQNLQQARKSANVRSNRRKAPARKQMSESNSVAGYLSKNLEQILRYLPNNLRNTLLDIEANENEPSVPFAAASSQNIKSAGITFRGHIEPKTTSKAAQSRLLNQGKLWTQKFLEDHLKLLERSVPTTSGVRLVIDAILLRVTCIIEGSPTRSVERRHHSVIAPEIRIPKSADSPFHGALDYGMIRFVGKKQSATAFVQTITVESIASIKQNSGTSGVTVVEAKVDSVEECINQLLAQLHSVAWALSQQWVRGLITDGSKFIFAVLDSRTNRYWISAPLQRLTSLKEIICLLAQWMIQDPKTTIQQDVAFNCL